MKREDAFEQYQNLREEFQEDVRDLLSESASIDKLEDVKRIRNRIIEKVDGLSWMLGVIAQEHIKDKDEEFQHKIVVEDVGNDKNYRRISFDINFGDGIGTHIWHKDRKIKRGTFKNKDEFYTPFLHHGFPEALAEDCFVSESYMKKIAEEVRKLEDILESIENNSLSHLFAPVGEEGMFKIYLSNGRLFKYRKKDDETKELIDYLKENNMFKFHNKYSGSDRAELLEPYNIETMKLYDEREVRRILNHSEEVRLGITNAEEELRIAEERIDAVIENIQDLCRVEKVMAFSL